MNNGAVDPRLRVACYSARELAAEHWPLTWSKLVEIATMLGVCGVELCELDIDGGIHIRNGELSIVCRSQSPPSRRRFTLAHEIGHLLFRRATGQDHPGVEARTVDWKVAEGPATRIACELLMPEQLLSDDLQDLWAKMGGASVSWGTARSLAHKYEVSLGALARRITELRDFAAVAQIPEVDGVRRRISRQIVVPTRRAVESDFQRSLSGQCERRLSLNIEWRHTTRRSAVLLCHVSGLGTWTREGVANAPWLIGWIPDTVCGKPRRVTRSRRGAVRQQLLSWSKSS